ncbi:polysaccharide biosynthesis tyrosine autokinase [Nostoc sp. FACHB-87]|uniref:GumC family protein n=1 Tax=Nostocaceae TaxID=1162 RepID=UPI001689E7DB|nr:MULTISPECIES: polysaccharide biosynthesis tyrosine autokinase [Nostocaceae]MBD2300876.1 polysaccharide biosynthesis tyrosine autokinase [Nostoc sp. FACHB-190]MBD2455127.1 polysaccharide biosynthesis tyrosine autokinase [Nostoc sp. FACHB-87]MBD2477865.1 polysaccharide biosynthesis tyrosine autokinase [Anabaena sp. FACHB-83]
MLKSEKHPYLSQAKSAQFNNNDDDELHIGQIFAILRRRLLLISGITALVATAAVLKAETDPPVYLGSFDILTRQVTGETKVIASVPQTISDEDATPSVSVSSGKGGSNGNTTIQVLRSPRVLDPIVEKLKPKYPYINYNLLVSGLIIGSESPDILTVQYTHPDKQLVSDVSKLLADAYLAYSLQERQLDVDQAIEFVDKQRQPIEARVKYWQNQLRNLQVENNLIDPAQRAQELAGQLAGLRQQRIENRLQLEQLVARYQDLQRELARNPGEKAGNSLLSENGRYQKILDQIQAVDIEIAQKAAVYTPDNPAMVTLTDRRAYLLPLLAGEEMRLQKELQSQIRSVSARDKFLYDKITTLNNDVRYLATLTRTYSNIQQQLEISNSSLTQFTTKQQALEIEKAQKQQPWRLLDPKLASVDKPSAISNNAKLNLAIGGILGLVLGIGAALIVDKLSNIFYTVQELKNSAKLPLLGIVPLRKELESAPQSTLSRGLQQTNRASFFEIYRSLYTNIMLLGSDDPIRSLVISSAGQGDGKSTVAVHLAQAAAAMGQRVLLVDSNLRCPSLHQRLGVLNVQGLTDVIAQDLDWENVIERSPIEDNLFVMTAGPTPPDSVRLLASKKMQDLMNELQSNFDLVIYDTPPLLGFADAYLLASNTNGIVMVAGLGHLKRTALKQVLEEIQISGTPLLGMIANKSKDSTPVSHDYYQQYYKKSTSAEIVEVETPNSDEQANSVFRGIRRR